jgi:hypothetical protein
VIKSNSLLKRPFELESGGFQPPSKKNHVLLVRVLDFGSGDAGATGPTMIAAHAYLGSSRHNHTVLMISRTGLHGVAWTATATVVVMVT